MRRASATVAAVVAAATAAVMAAGCSGGDTAGDGSSSATSSAAAAPSPELEEATRAYRAYAVEQSDELVRTVKTLTDAVRAGDVAAARAAFAPSRAPWERIEPIAELISDVDGKVDSRVDDFAGVDDPAFTGWHRLEYLVFDQDTTAGGTPFADALDADIAGLSREMKDLDIAPVDIANGAAELIEEVSQGKITGEEDRWSKTDLWDFDANLQGSKEAVGTLTPALQTADPQLLATIQGGFGELDATLAPLRRGDGWVLYCIADDPYPSPLCPEVTVDTGTVDTLKAQLASLSENLSQMSGALDLS